MLTGPEQIKACLPDSFLIWMPRDIVGGDIYHVDLLDDGSILAAVIDCTGHGVPGAFMSMIASSFIRRIVRSSHFREPSRILKHMNAIVKSSLQQEKKETRSDDGMDAAICRIHPDRKHLTFAAANLNLFTVHGGEAIVVKGDRQSIGYKRSDPDFDFTDHVIEIKKGISFYLHSDGFKDQLGGEKGRSFGNRRLKDLLTRISFLPFEAQKKELLAEFDAYKGANPRQDDVTFLGFGF